MRPVIYMGHPVSGDVEGNLASAKNWLRWLHGNFADATIIAPWIPEVQIYDDNDLAHREASLIRCCDTVRTCDAMIQVGNKISAGMMRESLHASVVFDCTNPNGIPPHYTSGVFKAFNAWIRKFGEEESVKATTHARLVLANTALSMIGRIASDHFRGPE